LYPRRKKKRRERREKFSKTHAEDGKRERCLERFPFSNFFSKDWNPTPEELMGDQHF